MENNISVTIALKSPDLDDEELQDLIEDLLPQLREADGVEQANLVAVEEIPEGNRLPTILSILGVGRFVGL